MKALKKLIISMALLGTMTGLTGCNDKGNKDIKVIMPTGTPLLGLTEYVKDHKDNCEIVEGADPLVAAFTKGNYDVVIAPVNLGAKLYNAAKSNFQLYETFVWGNLYIASSEGISSFAELKNKTITSFGKGSTPEIIMTTLIKNYQKTDPDFDINIEYVDSVDNANGLFVSGKVTTIVSAEPAISKIHTTETTCIDLQEEYSKATGQESYPQAAIFVNKDANNVNYELKEMTNAVKKIMTNGDKVAEDATGIYSTFNKLGSAVLKTAIPNCHFDIKDYATQKTNIETYFTNMNDNGFGSGYGAKLPDENFYYSK